MQGKIADSITIKVGYAIMTIPRNNKNMDESDGSVDIKDASQNDGGNDQEIEGFVS